MEGFDQSTPQDIQVAEHLMSGGPVNSSDFCLFAGVEPVSFDFQCELDGMYIGTGDDYCKGISASPGPFDYFGTTINSLPGQPEIKSLPFVGERESYPPLEGGLSESYFSPPDSCTSRNLCPCASLLFDVLQEMYRAEATCRLERGSGLPSNDHILKINRTAAQTLDQLLSRDCTDCLEDTSILFLIVTTMSKALSWYRAVFDRIDKHSPAKSPVNLMEPSPVTPIYFGDFELDIVAEQRITAQVLFYELGYISKVLCLIQESALGRMHNGREPISTLFGAISHFLSSTLNDLTYKVDELCASKLAPTDGAYAARQC
ncbi:hypothetical protein ABOM_009015 [Aspergillus bombycis]|uniref:Aflatoxin regulatory protein domain-containing protein n=1 Tax=Aspergillus bombycis TaxID=109264 RepID=A0A1F7ZTK7_9EURO|nr:hypothetical protein ABOM_009015 [Aspergillus bombycis]OGM42782.1 hypothetical protein ABOM_009015 [Aspergillus bombycis]